MWSLKITYSKKNGNKKNPCSLLVKHKTLTNPESMAEEFNEYFTSIGNNLKNKIPPTTKNFLRLFKVARLRNIFYTVCLLLHPR